MRAGVLLLPKTGQNTYILQRHSHIDGHVADHQTTRPPATLRTTHIPPRGPQQDNGIQTTQIDRARIAV